MDDAPDIAGIGRILADPGRAKILWALIDGTTRPAGELAFAANLSAQAASAHLAKLVASGLLTSEAQGRHRYFRMASADVADAIEGLASVSVGLHRPRPMHSSRVRKSLPSQFLHARTCYDHLAGEAAVQILDGMLKAKWLSPEGRDYRLTSSGERELSALGVDVETARRARRRAFARGCVDLTERRPHLSGALGAALLDLFVTRRWVMRARDSRVVTITPKGQETFRRAFRRRFAGAVEAAR
jgi:DNA-binding transcriptional ArsR family regulator